ncbi:MAG: cytochrome c [Candidatus Obscuribacterales bacterium]|nr:cytochrome c [Candidatus Obscuribacterales bacterium]
MFTVPKVLVIFAAFMVYFFSSSTAEAGSRSQIKTRIARGKKLFQMNGCLDCHKVSGKGFAEGVALDNLRRKRKRAFLVAHIRDPEQHVERNRKAFHGDPNLMPNPNLSEKEIKLVVDYLLSLPARAR